LYSWHTQRAPYKNYYYDINYHHCEGQNERQKYLNYRQDHRDDRQYVAKYNGGYTQHVRKEVKYLDGDGLQKRCAEDFVQAWKNLVGMTDKGEKRFEICQHDEERKFVGGKWACVETQAPTASPTMSPTESPTPLCHKYNCASWTCEDWCECYKDEDEDFYATQDGCGDDGDDTCVCFHHEDKDGNEIRDVVKDEVILNKHRHDKIMWRTQHKVVCGRHNPLGCKNEFDRVVTDLTEKHEVRCCADKPTGRPGEKNCAYPKTGNTVKPGVTPHPGVFGISRVGADNQCIHSATFAEAVKICSAIPNGRLCTAQELRDECTSNTGCGHDADLIWVQPNMADTPN